MLECTGQADVKVAGSTHEALMMLTLMEPSKSGLALAIGIWELLTITIPSAVNVWLSDHLAVVELELHLVLENGRVAESQCAGSAKVVLALSTSIEELLHLQLLLFALVASGRSVLGAISYVGSNHPSVSLNLVALWACRVNALIVNAKHPCELVLLSLVVLDSLLEGSHALVLVSIHVGEVIELAFLADYFIFGTLHLMAF